MICRGTYRWALFHNWGKWKTEEKSRTSGIAGYFSSEPFYIQTRDCARCGKRKIRKLN